MNIRYVAAAGNRFDLSSPDRGTERFDLAGLAARVTELERGEQPRWVWADSRRSYAALLGSGVSVERATDLRLCHRILRDAASTAGSALALAGRGVWDHDPSGPRPAHPSLLDPPDDEQPGLSEVIAEARRQEDAVAGGSRPQRLRLLLHAESAGALIAAEIGHRGLPWSPEVHDRQLRELLGERPPAGQRPAKLQALARRVAEALETPELNPDSPAEILAALRRAGFDAATTQRWEIAAIDHPAIAPLLEYKRLARLFAANGWAWLDTWVRDGRFHPDYVPGGVVTGRWATHGGGALQLPRALRGAVVAEPGWRLVVADVAQLEPRMLAAMSADRAMRAACSGTDLYQAFADRGVVATREQAKIGILAAMYGGTSGDAAEVLPRLRRGFPDAFALVDEAARAGERFERVTTWLGRTSPEPGPRQVDAQQLAYRDEADEADRRRARSAAREWGRFTRNFVVQGTAAEWALCWIASLRRRLRRLATASPAELVYFLHDEVIVHTPTEAAEGVVAALRAAAAEATQLMFGAGAVDVPLSIDVVDDYGQAHR